MGQQALRIALDSEGYIKAERQAPALQRRRLEGLKLVRGIQRDAQLVRLQRVWRIMIMWGGGGVMHSSYNCREEDGGGGGEEHERIRGCSRTGCTAE